MEKRFSKLYSRKLYVHHYEQYLDTSSHFEETKEAVNDLIAKYQSM